MRALPAVLARRMARSCVLKRVGRRNPSLVARTPRKGFASGGRWRYGTCLSPPISRVRMMTGLVPKATRTDRYASICSSSLGGLSRSRNRNSVRYSPTASAPYARAAAASAGPPMLAATSTRLPFPRITSRSLYWSRTSRSCRIARSHASSCTRSSGVGSRITVPLSPSTPRRACSSMPAAAAPSPTTAGMPRACARIAV